MLGAADPQEDLRVIARLFPIICLIVVLCGFSQPAHADVFEVSAAGDLVSLIQTPQTPISVPAAPHPQLLLVAADAAGLSADLVAAVAWCESRFRPRVVSPAGAIGEMQLMPGTARALGVDAYDTAQNYAGGSRYLAALLQRYDNDLTLALAAYNAGPGAVDKYHGIPPFRETRAYVAAVLARLAMIASHALSGEITP